MSKAPWRVSKKRLREVEAEIATICAAQEANTSKGRYRTRADNEALADLNGQYARATDARDRMRFTLWRKQRERERARMSDLNA